MNEMSTAEWIVHLGPQLTRKLFKKYEFVKDKLLPLDFEPSVHLKVTFGDVSIQRGNFVLPDDMLIEPQINFDCEVKGLFSVLAVDVDMPDPIENAIRTRALGSSLNLANNQDMSLSFPKWIPPHPAKGSDAHRIMFLLLQHTEPLEISSDFIELSEVYKQAEPVGVAWCMTTWTKCVSSVYREVLKAPEISYGHPVVLKE